jgi:hypothetical protein
VFFHIANLDIRIHGCSCHVFVAEKVLAPGGGCTVLVMFPRASRHTVLVAGCKGAHRYGVSKR